MITRNYFVEPPACLVDFLKRHWTPSTGMFAGSYDHNQVQASFVNNTIQRFVHNIYRMTPNERTTYLNKLIENRNIISSALRDKRDPQDVKRNIINSFWSTLDLSGPLYGQNNLDQYAVELTLEGMDCCIRAIRQLYPEPGPDMGPPDPGPDMGATGVARGMQGPTGLHPTGLLGGKSRRKRGLKNKQYRKRTIKHTHSRKKVKCARKST